MSQDKDRVRKVLEVVVEMDDAAGTMIEMGRDGRGILWVEGTLSVLTSRQKAAAKKAFLAAERAIKR